MERKNLETRGSFQYQWKNIPTGDYLLSDTSFRENVENILLDELDLPKEFLKDKLVVDAGCGNGRWTYGLVRLGCRVVAFDYTTSGCEETTKNTEQFNDFVDVVAADIFHIPLREGVFDIVFCWGVLHHTGNLESAFQNVANLLKPGGLLHIYVYGRKSWRVKFWRKILSQFTYNNRLALIKFLTEFITKFPRLRVAIPFTPSIHSTFDSYSPSINEESTEEQIVSLFRANDFKSFRRLTPEWCHAAFSPDIHMQGEKNV